MTQVNLLPWRERETKEQKIQFAFFLGLSVIIGAIFILIIHVVYVFKISNQLSRNRFLQTVIDLRSARLFSINNKEKELNEIQENIKNLESYKVDSYTVIRILDLLPRVMPDAVTVNRFEYRDMKLNLYGESNTNLQVGILMNSLKKSGIFVNLHLSELSSKKSVTGDDKYFELEAYVNEPVVKNAD